MIERSLKIRLKKARKKVLLERHKIDRARDRLRYWVNVLKATEERIGLVSDGQIEMPLPEQQE